MSSANSQPAPLAGVRVIESSMLGPAGITTHLADLGADVIKVEPPQGDYIREMTWPIIEGISLMHLHLNRGKKSIALDLGDALDRARFLELAARVDLLFEDAGPGELEALGLSPEALFERNPQLGIVRISPWGQDGPWSRDPATDFTLQAATGSTEYRGLPEREPVATGGRLAEWATGIYAAVSGLAVWRSARQIGRP